MGIVFEREKDLEDLLWANPKVLQREFGLHSHIVHRQMNLGTYGIADLVAVHSAHDSGSVPCCFITIIELKNEPMTHAHIAQLARYREYFMQFDGEFADFEVNCRLVGPKTFPASNDLCYLAQSIPWLEVYEFTLDPLSGLLFSQVEGWAPVGDNEKVEERTRELLKPKVREQVVAPVAANEAAP